MKQNILQNVINFIIKYIWFFCALLIILELVSVSYTSLILMRQSANGVLHSVSGDISVRVDSVLRLLLGMAEDERFADISKPLFDRTIQALPYQQSYNLYMIAMTDEEFNVISADEKVPPKENYSLAYREYMQKLYATGEYQITDAFLSGDGKETMNYTIAVPIMNNGKVKGSIFGSIYFDDIENILSSQSKNKGHDFYLFGENNTIIAGDNRAINGKSFMELSGKDLFLGVTVDEIDHSIAAREAGHFWQWDKEGLTYVMYQPIAPTKWTILYRIQFMSVFMKLIPILCFKIFFYFFLCTSICIFGKKYLNRHFAQVNHLLNRMVSIQKELFLTEQPDYSNLIELTEQALTDHLTGLATRAVLLKKMHQLIQETSHSTAIVFIDLDDLKSINDNFGHAGGDCALIYFAKILKNFEQSQNGIASRYGGDEFIFVFGTSDTKHAMKVIHDLCTELNTTIVSNEHSFSIHGSIGVAFSPEHGSTPEELICKADLALYTAKQRGKNQCAFFTDSDSII